MSRVISIGSKLALLPERVMTSSGMKATGKIFVALIPNELFNEVRDSLAASLKELKSVNRDRLQLMTSGDVQRISSTCESCNLCMVCAGKHRTYSRDFDSCWPPGKDSCFVYKTKGGLPLRAKPCELCVTHDKMLRKSESDRRRALTSESRLRSKIQMIQSARQNMFNEYAVDAYLFQE